MIKKKETYFLPLCIILFITKKQVSTYKSTLCILCEKCDERNFFLDPREYLITLNK